MKADTLLYILMHQYFYHNLLTQLELSWYILISHIKAQIKPKKKSIINKKEKATKITVTLRDYRKWFHGDQTKNPNFNYKGCHFCGHQYIARVQYLRSVILLHSFFFSASDWNSYFKLRLVGRKEKRMKRKYIKENMKKRDEVDFPLYYLV